MLAKILAQRHGFKCTVVFQTNPPDHGRSECAEQPCGDQRFERRRHDDRVCHGPDAADEQMRPFVEFLEYGQAGIWDPLQPCSHFDMARTHPMRTSMWATVVMLETCSVNPGKATMATTARKVREGCSRKDDASHPILRGVHDVWGPTDVYRITELPDDATVLMYGQVLTGMKPDDPPNLEKSTMPMVWTREIKRESGTVSRVVFSTIGAAQDMENEDLHRLYVNSVFWAVGLNRAFPPRPT